MSESQEAVIARLDERLNSIMTEMQSARDGRKQQYESLEKLGRTLVTIENRVVNVENSLAKASPTIDEFIVIKHKVMGAGILGRWLWLLAGSSLGLLYSMRETIISWLSK